VERAEAEAIYEQGRDVVVGVLLELSAQNERLVAQVERLTAQVARQEERIVQLERKTKRSSRTSSQPPSQDPPGAPRPGCAAPSAGVRLARRQSKACSERTPQRRLGLPQTSESSRALARQPSSTQGARERRAAVLARRLDELAQHRLPAARDGLTVREQEHVEILVEQ